MMVSCEKCSTQSSKDDMVCCKQCGCHYDRKCTEGLCDEAGDWMVPPTEIKQWLCNSCRQSPTHVRCDMCKSIVRETSRYAACGRCGRHVCRRCAALPPPAALRRAPWLCRECEVSVPTGDQLFGYSFAKHPALWKPHATEEQRRRALSLLAHELGLKDTAGLANRCRDFTKRYKEMLRSLAEQHRSLEAVTQHAPPWVRHLEQRLRWLPAIVEALPRPPPRAPRDVLLELARDMRRPHARARAVGRLAAAIACPAAQLRRVWSQACHVALLKLTALSRLGDVASPGARLSRREWLCADATLLASDKRAAWLVGSSNPERRALAVLLRLVQQFSLEATQPRSLRARWLSAYRSYSEWGLVSSAMVLQRRWWELKLEAHELARAQQPLPPLHALLLHRYPYVATRRVPPWRDLRAQALIVDVTEEDVKAFKNFVDPLPVADDDLILLGAMRLTTAIEEPPPPVKPEPVATPPRPKQTHTSQRTNTNDKTTQQTQDVFQSLVQNIKDDLLDSQSSMSDSLSALESIDPRLASTSIIFESDSDMETKSPEMDTEDDCQIIENTVEICELSDSGDELDLKTEDDCVNSSKVKCEDNSEITKTEDVEESSKDAMSDGLNEVETDKGSVPGSDAPQDRLTRPWGYKGPLQGRVEDLRWLCTPVSIYVEKLPKEVLNNVDAEDEGADAPDGCDGPDASDGPDGSDAGDSPARPVQLPDLEQVRRRHQRQLVAQVAPLQHDAEAKTPSRTSERTDSLESSIGSNKSNSPLLEDFGLFTQLPKEEDSDDLLSEEQLHMILNQSQPSAPERISYCCLARRDRAYNEARHRHRLIATTTRLLQEKDIHDAKHGGPPYGCGCCCLHLLALAPPRLAQRQHELLKSVEALLRPKDNPPEKAHSSNSEQSKRPRGSRSSTEDERLVIDIAEVEKQTPVSRKRSKSVAESKKKRPKSKAGKRRKKSKKTNKKDINVEQNTKDIEAEQQQNKNDDKDIEAEQQNKEKQQKNNDYKEWMRQKNSHRRFFELRGSGKDKSKKRAADHTYALDEAQKNAGEEVNALHNSGNATANATAIATANATANATAIATANASANATAIATANAAASAAPAEFAESVSSQEPTPIAASVEPVPSLPLNSIITHVASQAPAPNQIVVVGSTLLVPPLVPLPDTGSSYYMIYQEPSTSAVRSAPTMAIVPVAIDLQTPQAQPADPTPEITEPRAKTEGQTIFREDFRQQMVKNLSLLCGGGVTDVVKDDEETLLKPNEEPSTSERARSPRIFDELPSSSKSTDDFRRIAPALFNMAAVSHAAGAPVDDDDDDCVITSAPPKKIIIRTKKIPAARVQFLMPSALAREPARHVSTFARGAAFALLRLDRRRPLWAPAGRLVLTDAAVACHHIRYYVINCKTYNRPVPVHFEKPRIKVRDFARAPDAPAPDASEPDTAAPDASAADTSAPNKDASVYAEDVLADSKLYKKLSCDLPVYAAVLTALTDAASGMLLLEAGLALRLYSPTTDTVTTLDARERAIRCPHPALAQLLVNSFNELSPNPAWTVDPSVVM